MKATTATGRTASKAAAPTSTARKRAAAFSVDHLGDTKFEPSIRHREIAHSKDVEMIEIVAPADFRTLES